MSTSSIIHIYKAHHDCTTNKALTTIIAYKIITLSISASIRLTIRLPIHDHMNATTNKRGIYTRYLSSINHWPKYSGILVISTNNATDAIVATYDSLVRPNNVINAHLNTHHVPINHAVNHDKAHHTLATHGDTTILSVG